MLISAVTEGVERQGRRLQLARGGEVGACLGLGLEAVGGERGGTQGQLGLAGQDQVCTEFPPLPDWPLGLSQGEFMTHQCINHFSNKCSLRFFSLKKKKKSNKRIYKKTPTQCNNKGQQTRVGPLGPLTVLCSWAGGEGRSGFFPQAPAGTSP